MSEDTHSGAEPRIAVLVPCLNEEMSIGKVVADFHRALPGATIYVYDNNSTDGTADVAATAGAVVRGESKPGKGNVVRRMFADVEADIYVLVDGDDTYDAASAPALVTRLTEGNLDMVKAARKDDEEGAYRTGHRFGNVLLTRLVGMFFGNVFSDMLSGYGAFSRRFVKSFPALSSGFEIETELTVHALELRMPVDEISTPYKRRPAGSDSKLRTFQDGARIFRTIAILVKEERPLSFFSAISTILALVGLVLAWPVIKEFIDTGLVPRLPTAVLSTGLMLLSFLSLACGLILDTVTRGRREQKHMWYLNTPGIFRRDGAD